MIDRIIIYYESHYKLHSCEVVHYLVLAQHKFRALNISHRAQC